MKSGRIAEFFHCLFRSLIRLPPFVINGHDQPAEIRLPVVDGKWRLAFSSSKDDVGSPEKGRLSLGPLAIALLLSDEPF